VRIRIALTPASTPGQPSVPTYRSISRPRTPQVPDDRYRPDALLDEREAAWSRLNVFPIRLNGPAQARRYRAAARAFCDAEESILSELRRRDTAFEHEGRRYSPDAAGLRIEPLG
jgi:hypothetical protein